MEWDDSSPSSGDAVGDAAASALAGEETSTTNRSCRTASASFHREE